MLLQSIDVRPVFRIRNQYARWIDQHGEAAIPVPSLPISTQYKTAYYEKGITGRNIIVGVADTGIDVDMPVRGLLETSVFFSSFFHDLQQYCTYAFNSIFTIQMPPSTPASERLTRI